MVNVFPNNDSHSLKKMVESIVERAFIGYYAWMFDMPYMHLCVKTNHLAEVEIDGIKLPQDALCNLLPFVRRSFFDNGSMFPVFITPDMYKDLPLFLRLPYSYLMRKEGETYIWGLSKRRVSTTSVVGKRDIDTFEIAISNPAPKGICMWVYARNGKARKLIKDKNGDIEIDGVNFMLIVYNPNADYNVTKFGTVRGCWFILAQDKTDKQLKFRVLTRSMLQAEYGMDSINTIVAFKFYDNASKRICVANFTHSSIPLPPLPRYEAKNNIRLMNEFPVMFEYFKAHKEASNAAFLKELVTRGPGDDTFGGNLSVSVLTLHAEIERKIGPGNVIPVCEQNSAKVQVAKAPAAAAPAKRPNGLFDFAIGNAQK
jgi:hypothetical protein